MLNKVLEELVCVKGLAAGLILSSALWIILFALILLLIFRA